MTSICFVYNFLVTTDEMSRPNPSVKNTLKEVSSARKSLKMEKLFGPLFMLGGKMRNIFTHLGHVGSHLGSHDTNPIMPRTKGKSNKCHLTLSK